MSQRRLDLSKKIKACTTTYPPAFLNGLPANCQEMFTNGSHLCLAESECSLGSSRSSVPTVQLPRYELDVISYYELDENVKKTDEIIGKLSILGMKSFYSPDVRDSEPLISGFLTILNAHCAPKQLERSKISEDLLQHDAQPQIITLQQLDWYFQQELSAFARNCAIPTNHKDFYKFAIVVGLSCLLFLGKTVTSENIDDYLGRKWQTLAFYLGCENLFARKPNVKNCNDIHDYFFYCCERKALFELYRSLSKQPNNRFRAAFGFIVESLSWAGMEHIHLIDKYIVEKNPDLLSFSFESYFGIEKTRMKHVYKLLEQMPESDHPFLKLLLSYSQLTKITRNNFKYLYGAARAVASLEDPNISYIDREDTFEIINMKNHIKNYILEKKARGTNNM